MVWLACDPSPRPHVVDAARRHLLRPPSLDPVPPGRCRDGRPFRHTRCRDGTRGYVNGFPAGCTGRARERRRAGAPGDGRRGHARAKPNLGQTLYRFGRSGQNRYDGGVGAEEREEPESRCGAVNRWRAYPRIRYATDTGSRKVAWCDGHLLDGEGSAKRGKAGLRSRHESAVQNSLTCAEYAYFGLIFCSAMGSPAWLKSWLLAP